MFFAQNIIICYRTTAVVRHLHSCGSASSQLWYCFFSAVDRHYYTFVLRTKYVAFTYQLRLFYQRNTKETGENNRLLYTAKVAENQCWQKMCFLYRRN